jgi:hypothetical protein
MINQIKETLSADSLDIYKSIVSEATPLLSNDVLCKEVFLANSRETALSFLSFKKKGYVLNGFVNRVGNSMDTDDSVLRSLNELAKSFGHSMEKVMSREALELAFPL